MSSAEQLGWYARRVAMMSPAEMGWRAWDQVLRTSWSRRQVKPGAAMPALSEGEHRFASTLPPGAADLVPEAARKAVLNSAESLLSGGEWEVLGAVRTDMEQPDWFHDPVTGRRSDPSRCAFRIDHRSEAQVGNVKQLWEISRLHHLTLLATAWYLTHDDRYADRVADQLRSWWRENPFLSGVHWTSGIEIGIRLISLVWIRRLLNGWPGAQSLFERNPIAVQQIRWHQEYLAAFRSRGSSANNHVVAEAAGQLVASCAFPWFPESARWRADAARLLERELIHNTFPSGVGRELAADYHGFVTELGLVAAIEASASGHPISETAWRRLRAMADSAAALADSRLRLPRQGDSDDGRVLLLDAPQQDSGPALLAFAGAVAGRLSWWPDAPADVRSVLAGTLTRDGFALSGRPEQRPWRFADAGITVLRTDGPDEIWCRCDGGPHGFLSIAAHAHADALSVEVRYAGVDILADPGTYCYHGERSWRSYFRSTIAHNTVEIGGQNQSEDGGPFLWTRHADARETEVADDGAIARWTAEHDGYTRLKPPVSHRRHVRLHRDDRRIEITDELTGGGHDIRLAFHLGPDVRAKLDGDLALLSWDGPDGAARLALPSGLRWSLHRGETDPILGWYSPSFGRRVPAVTLLGSGRYIPGTALTTQLTFSEGQAEAR
jgi:hypothetical protein